VRTTAHKTGAAAIETTVAPPRGVQRYLRFRVGAEAGCGGRGGPGGAGRRNLHDRACRLPASESAGPGTSSDAGAVCSSADGRRGRRGVSRACAANRGSLAHVRPRRRPSAAPARLAKPLHSTGRLLKVGRLADSNGVAHCVAGRTDTRCEAQHAGTYARAGARAVRRLAEMGGPEMAPQPHVRSVPAQPRSLL